MISFLVIFGGWFLSPSLFCVFHWWPSRLFWKLFCRWKARWAWSCSGNHQKLSRPEHFRKYYQPVEQKQGLESIANLLTFFPCKVLSWVGKFAKQPKHYSPGHPLTWLPSYICSLLVKHLHHLLDARWPLGHTWRRRRVRCPMLKETTNGHRLLRTSMKRHQNGWISWICIKHHTAIDLSGWDRAPLGLRLDRKWKGVFSWGVYSEARWQQVI